MKEITKNDFFYVVSDNYDEHIDRAIHYYKEMHLEIPNFLNDKIKNPTILDLGCGTGVTTSILLDFYPDAEVIAIDLFDEMLIHAKNRLQRFKEQITYIKGDFRSYVWKNGIDVCVSALALHHILPKEKQLLFRNIYSSLNTGGRFILIDWTKFQSSFVQHKAYEVAIDYATKSVNDHKIVDSWAEHWQNINIPDTIDDMLIWLKKSGFKHAECVFRFYGLCMIIAEK